MVRNDRQLPCSKLRGLGGADATRESRDETVD